MNIYSVKDTPAEFFLPPFCARTHGQAQRMFVGSLGDSFPHREGFSLYCIGAFNDETGYLSECVPELILAGHSIAASLDPRSFPLDPELRPVQGVKVHNSQGTPS